ncbi:MAG: beta-lactamase [Frankiales bacterium]|nr:beta-lactamase [Frankiales bacterium]
MTLAFDAQRLARLDEHFAAYVDDGRLPGWQLGIVHRDELVHTASYGWRDRERGLEVEPDTLWRIASMTKPVASVAAMTLWEEGAFELDDPISRWIPSFEHVRVYAKGSAGAPVTVPATEPVRVWHLLTHTSGLTAGFVDTHVVDALYRKAGLGWGYPAGIDLAGACDLLAELPLLFEPGTRWGYGASTDVLGRLVELWSGQSLEAAVAARVTGPLAMQDTTWWVGPDRADRLAALYGPHPATGALTRLDQMGEQWLRPPQVHGAGGGLVSSTADYLRFARMLARGGELDGARVLAPRTVALMTQDHLPSDLVSLSTGGFAETSFEGVGFGLGFATVHDPVAQRSGASRGEFFWGGAASTAFWVDPLEDVAVVFMTQVLPSSTYPIRSQLRQLVYSALV